MRINSKRRMGFLVAAFAMILVGIILAGCSGSTGVQVICTERTIPGTIEYNCQKFDGSTWRSFTADEGSLVALDYEADVDAGAVAFSLVDESGETVWEDAIQVRGTDEVQLELGEQGRYQVLVEGDDVSGSFGITWDVSE